MRPVAILALLATLAAALLVAVATGGGASGPPLRAPRGPFVADGPKTRAIVWAAGDGADGGDAAKAVVRRIRAGRVDRFLYLGDVYDSGSAEEYRTHYATTFGALARRTAPTPGNHEWGNRGEGYEPYWRAITGRLPPTYYRLRAGGWELLSLNSEAPHDSGSAQLRWLRARLRSPGTCRLAFWHRPRLSAGRHGDQDDVAPLWEALRGHAALVVAGHDHNMQRFKPLDGLTQIVAGAGGHSHYAADVGDERLAFVDNDSYGALRIELRPGSARLQFVATSGRVLDRAVVRCRQATAT